MDLVTVPSGILSSPNNYVFYRIVSLSPCINKDTLLPVLSYSVVAAVISLRLGEEASAWLRDLRLA